MQIANSTISNQQVLQQNSSSSKGLSSNNFISDLDEEIQNAFNEASVGLDNDTKFKRAMKFSLNMINPPFMMFSDGNFPDQMPSNVKYALEKQQEEYLKLDTPQEKNIYKLDWMIEHIVHEQSSDPSYELFLQDVREIYSGEAKSNYKSRDEINDGDMALQQFKDDLSTKGAAKFLSDFNQEKIEEMVDKYRKELEEMMAQNPDVEMDIEKMLSDFRKQLLERLAELEEEGAKTPLHLNRLEFEIINKLQVKLEDLLQEKEEVKLS